MKKVCILFLSIFTLPALASGINANTASAPCTNNTLETYSGNTNLQADWAPNTINLTWYNENEKLTVQSSAQSCVYDGTLTIPSTQPTRTGYTFAGWEVKYTIPAGYTELEYLESTGTQNINTGIRLTSDNVIYEWNAKDNSTGRTTLFGCEYGAFDSANGIDQRLFSGLLYGDKAGRTLWAGATEGSSIGYVSSDDNFHSWVLTINSNRTAYLTKDGIQVGSISWRGESLNKSNTISLYSNRSTGGGYFERARVALKYFKITDDGNVVFNGIPAKRNSDGVLGMYDTVTQTFFTNAGSGSFVAGPAVQ